ncbi:DEAD/DEAH box helicase family protein [Rhodobacterales bacterium HKCCA1058]|nr:DEAD/DEAH box helicase family protein [Rhodobacterales bacterium HKCCA1058]
MTERTRDIRLFHKPIAEHRTKNDGLDYLSDWQVHSAHIVAVDIKALADINPFQEGPMFIPMPTGSGKTTGAIWAVEKVTQEFPEQKVCFLTPYQTSVGTISRELRKRLGSDVVGFYHSDAFVDKQKELKKQVVVLSHAFLTSNKGLLDDRDLFIVDEAIFSTGQATLQLSDIIKARDWATSRNIMASEFTKLGDMAMNMDQELSGSEKRYLAAPNLRDEPWVKAIAFDLDLSTNSQMIDDMDNLSAMKIFCEALLEGLVFLSKGAQDSQRYQHNFSCAVFGIPKMEKTAVLSATGGLIYDIAGPFQQSKGSKHYWTPPIYSDLKLVQLGGPQIKGRYSSWTSQAIRDQVVAYVDWLLTTIPEQEVYLTVPKQVLERCLLGYLGITSASDIVYPIKLSKHGKTLWVANHARAIGSNDFKDCEAVIYLWDDHKPQALSIQRFHTLSGEPVTDDSLAQVESGQLSGDYQKIKEAMYIDNMMQQIGRGRIRQFTADAVAYPMTAYVFTESANRFERLAAQYPDCTTTTMPYESNQAPAPTGRVERVLQHLRINGDKRNVPATDIEDALGFRISAYADRFTHSWDLMMLNYEYVKGGRGRGKAAYFRYMGGLQDP